MDKIKALVERLKHIAGVLQDYGTAHLTGEQAVTQRNAITFLREAAAALAPLAEPVEMPEEPRGITLAREVISNGHVGVTTRWEREWLDYIYSLRSALERALRHLKLRDKIIEAQHTEITLRAEPQRAALDAAGKEHHD